MSIIYFCIYIISDPSLDTLRTIEQIQPDSELLDIKCEESDNLEIEMNPVIESTGMLINQSSNKSDISENIEDFSDLSLIKSEPIEYLSVIPNQINPEIAAYDLSLTGSLLLQKIVDDKSESPETVEKPTEPLKTIEHLNPVRKQLLMPSRRLSDILMKPSEIRQENTLPTKTTREKVAPVLTENPLRFLTRPGF